MLLYTQTNPRSVRLSICPYTTLFRSVCPVRDRCAWRLAGYPPAHVPPQRVQKFAGTDRQVRGRLLDVLRAAHSSEEHTSELQAQSNIGCRLLLEYTNT